MSSKLPVVGIIGRPNVGKSTLFNRIVGRREAIVEERPGVTRDRKDATADWQGLTFQLVDTGGWLPGGTELDTKVSRQSERAMASADAILFVVDVTVGIVEEDAAVAEVMRRSDVPVLVVANKVDDTGREAAIWDLMGLGLGEPHPVSALHGRGTGDLLDALVKVLTEAGVEQTTPADDAEVAPQRAGGDTPGDLQTTGSLRSAPAGEGSAGDSTRPKGTVVVAVVGRPNVGKSTLFNRIVGDDRSVVHDMPGTTRDTVDTVVETPDGPICFVDTAGMRRKSRIDEGAEYYSFVRALQAIDRADVALLVIDATEGVTHQDQRLAERVDASGCPIVVVLNKWDLLDTEQRAEVTYQVGRRLAFVGSSPVLRMSALTGKGVQRLRPVLAESIGDYHRRVPTRKVNEVIRAAQQAQPAPHGARVLYATQGAADPPTFTLFANREIPRTYLRYLERRLKEAFDMEATPVKLRVRRSS